LIEENIETLQRSDAYIRGGGRFIRMDTSQLVSVSSQLKAKEQELDAIINQARALMATLESQFTGNRASKIFGEWEQIQGNLNQGIQSVESAGNLLNMADAAFSDFDIDL
jgi:uncharacterized protein YukE